MIRRLVFALASLALLIDSVAHHRQTVAQDSVPRRPENAAVENAPRHPFPRRIPAPDFPKDAEWLNTGGPLRLRDLKGKFVLIDFWTYCCINCIHILPELKKLEQAYPNNLVVIGCHSAKFDAEQDRNNIEAAILRYEIEHPVVNDPEHKIWRSFGARSWPTIVMIDPEGNFVARDSGEFKFETLDTFIKAVLPYYRESGLLDETPVRFDLLQDRVTKPTALRFPGKVLADETSARLFISDSNHNRVVVTDLEGNLIDIIGNGRIGRTDGSFADCEFNHPQGVALEGETLYIADTENHLLRKVDLRARRVTTIAGTGNQARHAWPGLEKLKPGDPWPRQWVGPPKTTGLNSPWALWVHERDLYVAMAGPHQIWKMRLDESEIGPFAGNGREDVVDGAHLPQEPYAQGFASFAQPSGLTSDGELLFVADSEGSSIRAVPFDPSQPVRTVVGTAELPQGRLFRFGDVDGPRDSVRLQHALGVAYRQGKLYVADTYNNKIKVIDAATGTTTTLAGSPDPGASDSPAKFDEPAGVSIAGETLYVADTNNHLIRKIDIATGAVNTLAISELRPPAPHTAQNKPNFLLAKQVALPPTSIQPVAGNVTLKVSLQLPAGWKINPLAPMAYYLSTDETASSVKRKVEPPASDFTVRVPRGKAESLRVKLSLQYFYCQSGGEGLCRVGSVVFAVPLQLSEDAPQTSLDLVHQLQID